MQMGVRVWLSLYLPFIHCVQLCFLFFLEVSRLYCSHNAIRVILNILVIDECRVLPILDGVQVVHRKTNQVWSKPRIYPTLNFLLKLGVNVRKGMSYGSKQVLWDAAMSGKYGNWVSLPISMCSNIHKPVLQHEVENYQAAKWLYYAYLRTAAIFPPVPPQLHEFCMIMSVSNGSLHFSSPQDSALGRSHQMQVVILKTQIFRLAIDGDAWPGCPHALSPFGPPWWPQFHLHAECKA